MFKLQRYFSLCSAAIIVLMTAMLAFSYRNTEQQRLAESAQAENISLAKTIANTTGDSIGSYVAIVEGFSNEKLRQLPETEQWNIALRRIVAGLPILKIRFHSLDGRTIYSSQQEEIGHKIRRVGDFNQAARNGRAVSMFSFRPTIAAFDAFVHDRYVVTSFLPVSDGTGKPRAVLEIFTDVTSLALEIRDHIWSVVWSIAGAFLSLYLALFLIVRRADRALVQQYHELQQFNASLEARVAERTAVAEAAATRANEANVRLQAEIEQRSRAQEALAKANTSLEEATQAKSMFLANMSHEIRTPMNGVFGMTDLLLRTELSDYQHRLASTISQSARNLLTVINDILDLSRIEAGKLEIDREELDLAHCLEGAVDLLNESAARKGLNLSLFIARDVPTMVWGDKGRLRQVCINLIGNAIKFTNEGEVAVRITAEAVAPGATVRRVRFEVRDTGIGIGPDIKAKLFKPFVQADASISRRFGGTGLGLAISGHIVGLMGGRIDVQSEVGKGTTLSFVLPMEVGDESKAPKVADARTLQGVRVLVVDDRETNREILCGYLAAAGAEAVQASSGTDALRLLKAAATQGRPFDVALSDMLMPDMSGLELLRRISGDASVASVKTIIVTSLSRAGDQARVRDAGGLALLTKPVRERDLISSVLRALGRQLLAPVRTAIGDAPRPVAGSVSYSGVRVLLAEDNPVNIEVAREYLTLLGCQISVAHDGREALEMSGRGGFDIVLMDCQMPEMDGLTATVEIRQREQTRGSARVPIVAVTANAFEEDRLKCLAAGMDDYLSKPFSEQQLSAVFRRWLPGDARAGAAAPTGGDTGNLRMAEVAATPRRIASGGVRPQLRMKLLKAYTQFAPPSASKLRSAVEAGDAVAMKLIAHGLKSSTANVGEGALADLFRQIEVAAGKGDTERCAAVAGEALSRLEICLAGFAAELDDDASETVPAVAAQGRVSTRP